MTPTPTSSTASGLPLHSVTTASESQCSALAAYGVDASSKIPKQQMFAILTVSGIPNAPLTSAILFSLEVECVTDRGGKRELLMSDAFTCEDLDALIAVLTAVRGRAQREGLFVVSHREDA